MKKKEGKEGNKKRKEATPVYLWECASCGKAFYSAGKPRKCWWCEGKSFTTATKK